MVREEFATGLCIEPSRWRAAGGRLNALYLQKAPLLQKLTEIEKIRRRLGVRKDHASGMEYPIRRTRRYFQSTSGSLEQVPSILRQAKQQAASTKVEFWRRPFSGHEL